MIQYIYQYLRLPSLLLSNSNLINLESNLFSKYIKSLSNFDISIIQLSMSLRICMYCTNIDSRFKRQTWTKLIIRINSICICRISFLSPMIYSDQYIEVTFAINGTHVYGIGERYGRLMIDAQAGWTTIPLWTLDQPISVCGIIWIFCTYYVWNVKVNLKLLIPNSYRLS